MPPEDKLKLLQHVRANWAELKQDTGLVTQFKEVVFIPVKGVPTKARSLFDPRRNVLKDIFGDEPDAFPQGEYAEDGWLDVLVDIGLRNKLDKETILQCAQKVGMSPAVCGLLVVSYWLLRIGCCWLFRMFGSLVAC